MIWLFKFWHFTTFSRACLRRAGLFPHKPLVLNHKVYLHHYAKNWNDRMIIFGENDRKHRFWHFMTFLWACARRVRFFPHKLLVPNHKVHEFPSLCKKLKRTDDNFLKKMAENIVFGILRHFHVHAQGVPDFFQKSGSVTFVPLGPLNIMQIFKKILWVVPEKNAWQTDGQGSFHRTIPNGGPN